jgi:hypothetical protein
VLVVGATDIQREGDGLAARIEVKWRGGFVGNEYVTTVLWRLNGRRHIQTVVAHDTAPLVVSPRNVEELDKHFATQVYDALKSEVRTATR